MSLMWIVLIHLEHDSINIAITRKLSLIILQNYLKQDWSRWLDASRELIGTLVHDVYVFCKAPVIMSCKWIKLILQFLCPVMIFLLLIVQRFCCCASVCINTKMSTRRKVLLKVIILGDSGWVSLYGSKFWRTFCCISVCCLITSPRRLCFASALVC